MPGKLKIFAKSFQFIKMSNRFERIQYSEDYRISREIAKTIANRNDIQARIVKKAHRLERSRLRREAKTQFSPFTDAVPAPIDLIAETGEAFSFTAQQEGAVIYTAQLPSNTTTPIEEVSKALTHERQGIASKRVRQYLKDIRSTLIEEFKLAFRPRS